MLDMEMIFGKLKEGEKIKTLPTIIDRHQYRYTQLFRKGRVAIYEQAYRPYIGFENLSKQYEVIIIRIVKEDNDLGIPAREAYPSSIDWGIKGWTFFNYTDATVKVGELLMKRRFTK